MHEQEDRIRSSAYPPENPLDIKVSKLTQQICTEAKTITRSLGRLRKGAE